MPDRSSKRPRDLNQLAKRVGDIATGQVQHEPPSVFQKRASKGGDARAKKLTAEERADIARRAARTRWDD